MTVPSLISLCANVIQKENNFPPPLEFYEEWDIHDLETRKYLTQQRINNSVITNLFKDNKNTLLAGQIQSGKTATIIRTCWYIQHIKGIHNVVMLRNITADILQFLQRVDEFNKNVIGDERFFLKVRYLRKIDKLSDTPETVVCLSNTSQSNTICKLFYKQQQITVGRFNKGYKYLLPMHNGVLDPTKPLIIDNRIFTYEEVDTTDLAIDDFVYLERPFNKTGQFPIYQFEDEPSIDYDLLIDEVDATKKTIDNTLKQEKALAKVKYGSKQIFGFSATGLLSITNDNFERVVKLPIHEDYIGVKQIIHKEIPPNVYDVYTHFLSKPHGIMLHNTSKLVKKHFAVAFKLKQNYPQLTVMVHNGRGITVLNDTHIYENQNRRRYSVKQTGFGFYQHCFKRTPFNYVLQLVKDEGNCTHVSIVSRVIASRGMSYVSEDYQWHITDQILLNMRTTRDSLLQSLRLCGIWKENKDVTLWTKKNTYENIKEYYHYTEQCMEALEKGDTIDTVAVSKPIYGLFNHRLLRGMNWVKDQDNYYLVVQSPT